MNKYRRARERAGFTQKELSKMIGVEPSVISRYELEGESNSITPPQARRENLARACGIDIEFLENNNPKLKSELTLEQKARFRKEIENLAEKYKHHPDYVRLQFGNSHPFQYMLKERWIPIVEDVYYLSAVFGTNIGEILTGIKDSSESISDLKLNQDDIEGALIDKDIEQESEIERKIDKLLLDFYATYTDEDIINTIIHYTSFLSRRGIIELLRVVQEWDAEGKWHKTKTPQDQNDPETKE